MVGLVNRHLFLEKKAQRDKHGGICFIGDEHKDSVSCGQGGDPLHMTRHRAKHGVHVKDQLKQGSNTSIRSLINAFGNKLPFFLSERFGLGIRPWKSKFPTKYEIRILV